MIPRIGLLLLLCCVQATDKKSEKIGSKWIQKLPQWMKPWSRPASSLTESSSSPSTAVAIIGCGPGGLFFLHALETKRRELQAEGDLEAIAALPRATCFERAPGPGGVWRADRNAKKTENPTSSSSPVSHNMYEALWTNGAKESTEFFDYTYREHFGRPVPVFLPRKTMLDYILTRITRHSPTLLDDHARFNTLVVNVKYEENKFQVTTRNLLTDEITNEFYDKCIWAAGDNGKPFIPSDLKKTLQNFTGPVIHSSKASDLVSHVQNKTVVMVGGSFSAEDLALMSIKLGVSRVYISTRKRSSHVSLTEHWPQNKVKVLPGLLPVSAEGKTIGFGRVSYYEDLYEFVSEGEDIVGEVKDVDTVIFCTGYRKNHGMLDESLRPPTETTDLDDFSIPSTWEMNHNELTPDLGAVPVGEVVYKPSRFRVKPGLYRGVLISNPSMMFLHAGIDEAPLLELDVVAHQFLAYITGTTPLPSTQEEMALRNNEQFQHELQMPMKRFEHDPSYRKAVAEIPTGHWLDDWLDRRNVALRHELWSYPWLLTALKAEEGHYPVNIGSFQNRTLSETGKKYYLMLIDDDGLRSLPNFSASRESEWRTFRDYDEEHAHHFVSVFTGDKAVPLSKRWMEIDENSENEEEW